MSSSEKAITFATAFYNFSGKFPAEQYIEWADNFFKIVSRFCNIVCFTDEINVSWLLPYSADNVKIIVLPIEQWTEFSNADFWRTNHENNTLLNRRISSWEINMLWSEKPHFVKRALAHFKTAFYGWLDIGYFRCREGKDLSLDELSEGNWGKSIDKTSLFPDDKHKIVVGSLIPSNVSNQITEVNPSHNYVANGAFILRNKDAVNWWAKCYRRQLMNMIDGGVTVKDDQHVVATATFIGKTKEIHLLMPSNDSSLDQWFMFQSALLNNT